MYTSHYSFSNKFFYRSILKTVNEAALNTKWSMSKSVQKAKENNPNENVSNSSKNYDELKIKFLIIGILIGGYVASIFIFACELLYISVKKVGTNFTNTD